VLEGASMRGAFCDFGCRKMGENGKVRIFFRLCLHLAGNMTEYKKSRKMKKKEETAWDDLII
jgi:hypothetical protein